MNDFVKLYACPNCARTAEEGSTVPFGVVQEIKPLVGNVTVNTLVCPVCGCAWRVYTQVSDANIEVVRMPEKDVSTDDVASVADEEVSK